MTGRMSYSLCLVLALSLLFPILIKMVSFYIMQFLMNDYAFVSLYYKIKMNSDFSGGN